MPRNNKPSGRAQQPKPRVRDAQSREIRRGASRSDRRLSVRSELRREPDVRRIARAVIELAMAQAEADAANAQNNTKTSSESSEVSS